MELTQSDEEYTIEEQDELLMHTLNTLPEECQKFWKKRYDLFSKFDSGIYMTSELWFSVTPEPVAKFTAQLVKELLPKARQIVDVCCGGGGNTIQFGTYFEIVGGIDIKPINIQCTQHNAMIYDIKNIWTVVGDWNKLSQDGRFDWKPNDLAIDFMFCSPPWGGTRYNKTEDGLDLLLLKPFAVDKLIKSMLQYCNNIGLFLPRSSNLTQLRSITSQILGPQVKCRVVYMYYRNHCIGMIALFGSDLTEKYIIYSDDVLEN